jgi:hypothetical protein
MANKIGTNQLGHETIDTPPDKSRGILDSQIKLSSTGLLQYAQAVQTPQALSTGWAIAQTFSV